MQNTSNDPYPTLNYEARITGLNLLDDIPVIPSCSTSNCLINSGTLPGNIAQSLPKDHIEFTDLSLPHCDTLGTGLNPTPKECGADFSNAVKDIAANPSEISSSWELPGWCYGGFQSEFVSKSIDAAAETPMNDPEEFMKAVESFLAFDFDNPTSSRVAENGTSSLPSENTTFVSEFKKPSTIPNFKNFAAVPELQIATSVTMLEKGNPALLMESQISLSQSRTDPPITESPVTNINISGPYKGDTYGSQKGSESNDKPRQDQSPNSLYMTDSSPKSDHEAEKTSLDGSNATSSKAEGRGSQLQEFNIPCLTAFGLRVDQEKIALVAGAGEMLPYPESTPVLTLGRGKKKTRKISLMTNEELKDSFSGILNDSQLLQQKEIQEWSGACFSALALEASNFAARSDQAHSKQPPIVFDGLLDLETKSFQRPDASVHDWSTKNKLNLTVNTRLQPSRYGDFSQVAQAQMSSFSHQQPDFREIPFQNFNLPLDLINRGMDSAPAVFPNTASLKNGYYKSLKGHLLPTPPHSAGWLEPQNQFERPATMTCHEQFQVGYCNSHAKGVMEVKPKFGIDIGLFDSLPTPNSATFSSVHTPDSAAFQQSDVSFPLAPNVEFPLSTSSYLISHKLNSPTTTGGLPLTPLDIGTTFGDNTLPLNIFDQETQTCKNTFSLHQAPLSNITNEYTKQISGQKRVIQATDEYGNTRELKRNALTCDIFQNSYENLTQLKEDTSVTLAKKGSFGTRLKPGPKSKSTLIQHPPPLIHIGRTGGPGESGGIPKDILKCFYEPIHQSSQDTEGILTINKRYVCKMESCGRLFPRKTAIESHIQTHLEDKPFVCPVRDCNAAFVRQHDLRRHEHIHSGKKPFNCECGKGFARGDALMRHRQRGICVGSMVPRRC